jgi:hypothetical protein
VKREEDGGNCTMRSFKMFISTSIIRLVKSRTMTWIEAEEECIHDISGKERDHCEDQDEGGCVLLKRILRKLELGGINWIFG